MVLEDKLTYVDVTLQLLNDIFLVLRDMEVQHKTVNDSTNRVNRYAREKLATHLEDAFVPKAACKWIAEKLSEHVDRADDRPDLAWYADTDSTGPNYGFTKITDPAVFATNPQHTLICDWDYVKALADEEQTNNPRDYLRDFALFSENDKKLMAEKCLAAEEKLIDPKRNPDRRSMALSFLADIANAPNTGPVSMEYEAVKPSMVTCKAYCMDFSIPCGAQFGFGQHTSVVDFIQHKA
jgi:hypothetical protein